MGTMSILKDMAHDDGRCARLPASLHIPPQFITLVVLGVFGAGFIEEIRRIAVVDCVWFHVSVSEDAKVGALLLDVHQNHPVTKSL